MTERDISTMSLPQIEAAIESAIHAAIGPLFDDLRTNGGLGADTFLMAHAVASFASSLVRERWIGERHP